MARTGPESLRLAVNTQTPLVRFRDGTPVPTTGGVTRMLMPLLRRWRGDGTLAAVEWVAMGADPETTRLRFDDIDLTFVGLDDETKRGYAAVKEKMWELLNSNPSTDTPHGEHGIPEDAWAAFDAYQAASADALLAASHRMGGVDLLYVHDFQQIGVAEAWKGPAVPKLFHLHTPFPSVLPAGWAEYFVARLRNYDAIVVSTQRYADNLRAAGLDTPIHVIHPFIDPSSYPPAPPDGSLLLRDRFGIAQRDRIVLNVGRMDPMKGQDRLLQAMPAILAEEPRARLLLVGNGSFSSAKRGGLGLDKGLEWRNFLEAVAKEIGVSDRVTFTGHLDDDLLPAAYEACEVFALPSTREGFGLAAIEAWRHERPVVVSDRAGVSDLVHDRENGVVVDGTDVEAIARAITGLLRDPVGARAMGSAGRETSQAATLAVGARALSGLFARIIGERPIAHV